MRALAVVLLLSGCDALFNLDHVSSPDDGGDVTSDGARDDSPVDADTQNICIGTGRGFHPKFCYPIGTPFQGTLSLTGTVDTSTSAMCDEIVPQMNGPAICIKKAETIVVTTTVRVIGSRPLVLLASDRITITGTLDVSSNRTGSKGAGANTFELISCSVSFIDGNPGAANSGGSGGAGGSFKSAGGNGGNGDLSIGGIARAAENPNEIRGGCNGGNGGPGNGTMGSGTPGAAGGGAIYLAATNLVSLLGTIAVNGAGGGAGTTYFGGAGGGAGGMIVLDAPMVSVGSGASLLAIGGGGGQGGSSTGPGGDGMDGPIAAGGTSGGSGGSGGNGSQASGLPGASGLGGGGGGGGGGGYIAIASPNAMVDLAGSHRPQPIIQ